MIIRRGTATKSVTTLVAQRFLGRMLEQVPREARYSNPTGTILARIAVVIFTPVTTTRAITIILVLAGLATAQGTHVLDIDQRLGVFRQLC